MTSAEGREFAPLGLHRRAGAQTGTTIAPGGAGDARRFRLHARPERSLSSQVERIDLNHAELLVVVRVTYKGSDPTYGMETDPERLCELLEAMLDVAQALAPVAPHRVLPG